MKIETLYDAIQKSVELAMIKQELIRVSGSTFPSLAEKNKEMRKILNRLKKLKNE
jgi:hypothetical protein